MRVNNIPDDVRVFVLDERERQIKKWIQNNDYNPDEYYRSHIIDCLNFSEIKQAYRNAFASIHMWDYKPIRKLIENKKKAKEIKMKRGDKNNKEKYKYKWDFQTYPERVQDLILCERRLNSIHIDTHSRKVWNFDINNMLYWLRTRQWEDARSRAYCSNYSLLEQRIKQNPDLPHK